MEYLMLLGDNEILNLNAWKLRFISNLCIIKEDSCNKDWS